MEGILLVDKPKGPSSFEVVRRVRSLAKIKRVGHAGTLDPMATGLLVICLGRYTKLASLLTENDKIYQSIFTLGQSTTTDDCEGEIITNASLSGIDESDVLGELKKMRGKSEQLPPQYSAIKIGGKRAYQLARKGEEIALKKRPIEIFDLQCKSFKCPDVEVTVHCSKGTYIRSIARDLGEVLKTGAFAKEIRRLKSGAFLLEDAIPFADLTIESIKSNLLTGLDAVGSFEKSYISEEDAQDIRFGRTPKGGIKLPSSHALAMCGDELVAVLRQVDGQVSMRII